MKCAIVCGGVKSVMPPSDSSSFLIACDRGYDYCIEDGLVPDLVVGDFDSSSKEIPLENAVVLPHEKDDTDSLYAVRLAIEKGATQIELYCAMGGRPDHHFANIQVLAFCLEKKVDCRIISADSMLFLCDKSCMVKKESYTYLSVFSWTEKCSGVSIKGAKYSLEDAELSQAFPIGISNEWQDNQISLSVKKGILLVMCVMGDSLT
ncbi:MAG: thiamine diphosphokinase [Treponema sp.]|nr:thiamine diphosphokinase [Treponema sp.]